MFVVPAHMLSPGWIGWLPWSSFFPFRYMLLSFRTSIVLCTCVSAILEYMARLAAMSFSEIWSQGRLPIRMGFMPIVERCCTGASISMDIMFSDCVDLITISFDEGCNCSASGILSFSPS